MQINGRTAYKLPDKNIICFYWEPRKNEAKTRERGSPVYDQVLMGEIHSPGMKNQVHRPEIEIKYTDFGTKDKPLDPPVERVRDRMSGYREPDSGRDITWREYLGEALQRWEKDQEAPDSGTPLETWPKLDVAQIATLREQKIYSVEMLADVPDSRLEVLGIGGRTLRDQAKAFLEAAKGNAVTEAAIARAVAAEDRIARLEATIAQIQAAEKAAGESEMTAEQVTQKRGPGRPPKVA